MRVLDRAQGRIPKPWRTVVDWLVTIAVATAFVLTCEAQVAKPYRIPSPSMEPTLHCAKPTEFCQGQFSDRVIANRIAYRLGDPKRGQIVVFRTPEAAQRCGLSDGGSTFVKRIIGLPGELISERDGTIFVNGEPSRGAVHRSDAARSRNRPVAPSCAGPLLRTRRQPDPLLRLPHLGNGASWQLDRPCDAHVLAAQPRVAPLARRPRETGMEAAGIEPASAVAPNRASTSVVRASSHPTAGSRTTCRRASHPEVSRFGRLALPPRQARFLAPNSGSRAQPGSTSPDLASTRRRVRVRSCSHLLLCRLIYEANRRPRLATLPENRPRRNLIAPVCVLRV